MSRSFSLGKLALAPIVLALILTLSACGGGDEPTSESSSPPSAQPSSGTTSTPSDGATIKPVIPKGCEDIAASGAVEDIAKLFDHYLQNPQAANALDAPAMRTALEELAKAGDNAPMKVREDALTLVSDMGALVDTYLGLEGVSSVPSTEQIQQEIDSLCASKG